MNHSNMYIVGLALCTFGNIASEEMSRDLCNEVEKLMGSSNTYIRRKVKKSPTFASADLADVQRFHNRPRCAQCASCEKFQTCWITSLSAPAPSSKTRITGYSYAQ